MSGDTKKMPRILVVDDDESMRELLALHLRNAGYEVELAEDAVVGGRLYLRCAPELLLIDIDMPYMSGLEFVATLLADSTVTYVPVVFISANANMAEAADALGAEFLAKPLLAGTLLDAVARNLARPQSGRRAPADVVVPLHRAAA